MTFEEKTISSELIYDGSLLKLRRDKVKSVNGESYREILEHMGGAVILPIDDEGNIFLVKQFRKAVEKVMLEVPAGKIDKGESPLETAIRELKEETGIIAKEIIHLTDIFPSVGYSGEKLYIYLAKGLSFGETDFDENEALDLVKMSLDEAYELVMSGKMEDAKSIIAILMAQNLKV